MSSHRAVLDNFRADIHKVCSEGSGAGPGALAFPDLLAVSDRRRRRTGTSLRRWTLPSSGSQSQCTLFWSWGMSLNFAHRLDDQIFEHMKTDFPELFEEPYARITKLDEDWMKSKDGKERWRKFIESYVAQKSNWGRHADICA